MQIFKKILFALLFVFAANTVFSQSLKATEDVVFLDLNTGIPVTNTSFTDVWNPAPFIHFNLRPSFYDSQLELGMRYTRFEGNAPTETDSDFQSLFFYVGYSYPLHITSRYSIGPTVRFGNNLMIFDKSEVFTSGTFRFETDTREMEFAYEFALRNQFELTDRWFIHATLSYNRILTNFPISLTLVSAGFSYAFPQSPWFKKLLR